MYRSIKGAVDCSAFIEYIIMLTLLTSDHYSQEVVFQFAIQCV